MPPIYQVCPNCRHTVEAIGCTKCPQCGGLICGYAELKLLFTR